MLQEDFRTPAEALVAVQHDGEAPYRARQPGPKLHECSPLEFAQYGLARNAGQRGAGRRQPLGGFRAAEFEADVQSPPQCGAVGRR